MALPELRWASTELAGDARRAALAALSPLERARYDSAVAGRDAFLAGRLVLRSLAGELLDLPPAAVDLVAVCPDCGGPHGRPAIPGSALRLSLSRGAGVVVAAASWGAEVGVDVEPIDVSPERLAAIGSVTGEASVLHWTRVEAVLKADGRGLRVDPARVSLVEIDGRLEGRVADSSARYGMSGVELVPGLLVSVAVRL